MGNNEEFYTMGGWATFLREQRHLTQYNAQYNAQFFFVISYFCILHKRQTSNKLSRILL